MIESVSIQNFQSHKNTTLQFCNGVNVIIGSSDSGKSAIIRALNWVINNRPTGDSFRSSWGGDTSVFVLLGDRGVERIKTDKDNLYRITYDIEAAMMGAVDVTEDFRAIGTDVPKEVQTILRFDPLNIQYQMDAPFLLSWSSGEVARILNSVTKLDDIDRALSGIESRRRRVASDLNSKSDLLDQAQARLMQFANLPELENKMKKLVMISNDLDKLTKESALITGLIGSIEETNAQLNAFSDLDKIENKFQELRGIKDALTSDIQKVTSIQDILEKVADVEFKIEACDSILSVSSKVDEAVQVLEEISNAKKKYEVLSGLISNIHTITDSIDSTAECLDIYQKEFDDLMPDTCPLCGQEVRHEV